MEKKMEKNRKNAIKTLLLFCAMYLFGQVVASLVPSEIKRYVFYGCLFVCTLIVGKVQNVELPVKMPNRKSMTFCIIILVFIYPLLTLLSNIGYVAAVALSNGDTESSALYSSQSVDVGSSLLVTLFVTALLPAVVEEMMTRGLIQGAFNKFSPFLGLAISAVIFGALHVSIQVVPFALFVGVLFGVIRQVTGNLIYTIVLHFLFNASSAIMIFYDVNTSTTWGALIVRSFYGAVAATVVLCLLMINENSLKEKKENEEAVETAEETVES